MTHKYGSPVLNFMLLRADGCSYYGHAEVEKLASVNNIHLRTGCFCNSGACHKQLGITLADLKDHVAAGKTCGDDLDLIKGRPTGSIRISFGYMSTIEDANLFLTFIATSFQENGPPDPALVRIAAGSSTDAVAELQAAAAAATVTKALGESTAIVDGTVASSVACDGAAVSDALDNIIGADPLGTATSSGTTTATTTASVTVSTLNDLREHGKNDVVYKDDHDSWEASVLELGAADRNRFCEKHDLSDLATSNLKKASRLHKQRIASRLHKQNVAKSRQAPGAAAVVAELNADSSGSNSISDGAVVSGTIAGEKVATETRVTESSTSALGNSITTATTTAATSMTDEGSGSAVRLETIAVFPVKSCKAFNALSWEIGPTGLAYDRNWLVLDQYGSCITQKQVPKMCLICPTIDLAAGTLELSAPAAGMIKSVAVPLEQPTGIGGAGGGSMAGGTTRICRARVCFDIVNGVDCGDEVSEWLTNVVGKPCRLVRQLKGQEGQRRCRLDQESAVNSSDLQRIGGGATGVESYGGARDPGNDCSKSPEGNTDAESDDDEEEDAEDEGNTMAIVGNGGKNGDVGASKGESQRLLLAPPLAFANESQFLLTSEMSMENVRQYKRNRNGAPLTAGGRHADGSIPVDRFRGNLVIAGGVAFQEDSWRKVRIGTQVFKVSAAITPAFS